MFDNLIKSFYWSYFLDEKNDGFLLLCSSVCIRIMSEKYRQWVANNELEAIEKITHEQKLKFWNLACKYQTDPEKKLMASQAAYALELMTGKIN